MPEQRSNASDSGRPSSRGRSYSNASRRGGAPSRQNPPQAFQTHHPSPPSPPTSQPSYHGQYPSSSSPYDQHGMYGSGQYAISPPPPHVSMVGQQPVPAYSYTSHPSLLIPDTSMQPQTQLLQGYSPNTLVPVMQPHTPVYTYPAHSPEAASSSSQPYAGSPAATSGLYPSAPSAHSHLTSPNASQPISPAYTSPSPYATQYPSPHYVYPSPSYAHSGNTLYQGQFSYAQQYRPPLPAEQEHGTWWYLPPGTRPALSPHYHAYDNAYPMHTLYPSAGSHEAEAYSTTQQAGPSTMPSSFYPMPPLHQPPYVASPPSQPQLQRPSGPDPPPPLGESSSRSISDPPRSDVPSSPATMNHPDRQHLRKSYHPIPPASRSEWVMWAGNVPSDATHDELWRFFHRNPFAGSSRPRSNPGGDASSSGSFYSGVSSIHLITRSNCAFVNFENEDRLRAAIARFDGRQLRPTDPRCPRLVCRIRAREDDLRAGVGGQRGAGIHIRHIKDQKQRQKEARTRAATSPETSFSEAPLSTSEDPSQMMAALSLSSDEEGPHAGRYRKPAQHSSSSGSYASTNSSLLTQYFPKRYFILKSLTQVSQQISAISPLLYRSCASRANYGPPLVGKAS